MGRKLRVEYEGAIYHVIQRGNNREFVFDADEDKAHLLELLGRCKKSLGFTLFGFVVMGNHYHLILQSHKVPLSRIMHQLNGNYSRYFNRKRGRSGHVFQGRYKGLLVQDERYLVAVLRYIHRNPVVVGACQAMSEYLYSSDIHYRSNRDTLVDIGVVLDMLTDDRQQALKLYADLMAQDDPANYEDGEIIGDDAFALAFQPRTPVRERKRLDEILAATGASMDDLRLIKEGSRKRHLIPYKTEYAAAALGHGYTFLEIAHHIAVTDRAIRKLLGTDVRPSTKNGLVV